MASALSHAVAALSIGTYFYRPGIPKRVWVAGTICSVIPDFDVIGFHFGIRYGDFWGHRGFTHSLLFAAVLATLIAILIFHKASARASFLWIWRYLFLATASHSVLDAMTDGGLGVAFFSPFNNDRHFSPGAPSAFPPLASAASSPNAASKFSRANSFGSGSPPRCLQLWPGSGTGVAPQPPDS